jgi:hypothetical protein
MSWLELKAAFTPVATSFRRQRWPGFGSETAWEEIAGVVVGQRRKPNPVKTPPETLAARILCACWS